MAKKDNKKKESNPAALYIPAGLFLGFGIGFATGNIPAGIFSGFGVGFLLYAIAMNRGKK
ncbi:MAG: hypothetical protein KJ955_08820 [Nanoarchaeota archaeon]|nr:hypothetical protein [Nanoarchaeota archaeon]